MIQNGPAVVERRGRPFADLGLEAGEAGFRVKQNPPLIRNRIRRP